jgi:DNA polymerase-3 subunit delta
MRAAIRNRLKQKNPKPKTKNNTIMAKLSIFPIYVVEGEEKSLVDIEVEKIFVQLLEPAQMELGLIKLRGNEAVLGDCLDELRTLPFLAPRRVVVIKDAEDFISDNREPLEDYFENPSPTGVLILTINKLATNTNIYKKLSKCGKLVSVAKPTRWTLPNHLIKYAEEAHRKKLERDAAVMIVDIGGEDYGVLTREVDKLAAYTNDKKAITIEDVQTLTGHNRLFNAFEVFDKALSGNTAQAIALFRDMLSKDKDAEYKVVGAFWFQVRRMFDAKVLLVEGVNPFAIVKRLGIRGDSDSFLAHIRNLNLEFIGSLAEELGRIDYQAKTGQAFIEVEMEKFILKLAS